jgi:Transposase and inactivated derivatives
MVNLRFRLDPCLSDSIFLFCNKKRNTIKLLKWDGNGFLLATKKLMEEMRFQWPKSPEEILDITQQEYKWLLEGLRIDQPGAHRKLEKSNIVY